MGLANRQGSAPFTPAAPPAGTHMSRCGHAQACGQPQPPTAALPPTDPSARLPLPPRAAGWRAQWRCRCCCCWQQPHCVLREERGELAGCRIRAEPERSEIRAGRRSAAGGQTSRPPCSTCRRRLGAEGEAAAVEPVATGTAEPGREKVHAHIVNGKDAAAGRYPYIASLWSDADFTEYTCEGERASEPPLCGVSVACCCRAGARQEPALRAGLPARARCRTTCPPVLSHLLCPAGTLIHPQVVLTAAHVSPSGALLDAGASCCCRRCRCANEPPATVSSEKPARRLLCSACATCGRARTMRRSRSSGWAATTCMGTSATARPSMWSARAAACWCTQSSTAARATPPATRPPSKTSSTTWVHRLACRGGRKGGWGGCSAVWEGGGCLSGVVGAPAGRRSGVGAGRHMPMPSVHLPPSLANEWRRMWRCSSWTGAWTPSSQ